MPTEFVAATATSCLPDFNPVNTTVTTWPCVQLPVVLTFFFTLPSPLSDVTVTDVMGEPLPDGIVNCTLTELVPRFFVVVIPVGASGTAAGVMKSECAEVGPVPAALIAATSNSYATPLVSPGTVNVVAALPVRIAAWATALMNGVTA
ncbi:MAG: hypothetical protein JWM34_925 [Ilumatobacteraceae bacterium]|nr:hypothetical protein [Ilumatobacteraceae bacterium]